MRQKRRTRLYCSALIVAALALVCPVRLTVACGESMAPTLENGAVCVLDTRYYRQHPVVNGDVIVFRREGKTLVKRVAAVAGETVFLVTQKDGAGAELLAPWQLAPLRRLLRKRPWAYSLTLVKFKIPEGMCYVLGDNPAASEDSRTFGAIPVSSVQGKVLFTPPTSAAFERVARRPRTDSGS